MKAVKRMGYSALLAMRQRNRAQYGIEVSVRVPELPHTKRRFGAQALAFIRDDCEDLQFDMASPERTALTDADGKRRGEEPDTVQYGARSRPPEL